MKFSTMVISIALFVGGFIGWQLRDTLIFRPAEPILAVANESSNLSDEEGALRQKMRKLWGENAVWTRFYFIDFTSKNGFANTDGEKLLVNQKEIGTIFKLYFGENSGNDIGNVMREYTQNSMEFLDAVMTKDDKKIKQALEKWYTIAFKLADTLAELNPQWSREDLRAMLKTQVELTKEEAINIVDKEPEASVKDFDKINAEVLHFSDVLTDGIVQAYPSKF